jgi:hypothetical protein
MTETKERVLNEIEKIIKQFTDGVTNNGELLAQIYECVASKKCTSNEFTNEMLFMFSIKQDEILDDAHKALAMLSPFYDGEYDEDDEDDDECGCEDCECCKKPTLN